MLFTDCKIHGFSSYKTTCPYCKQEAQEMLVEAATNVIHAASIGDQHFIECLRSNDPTTVKLRLAIVELADRLRET